MPRAASVAWLWLAVALLLAGCTPRERFGSDALTLAQGEVLEAGATLPAAPPPADARWQPVTLPDAWDASRPDFEGYVWYRLRFDTPAHWQGPLAVYLPSLSMNARLELNGQFLGLQGRIDDPATRNFYTPLLFDLPRAMLAPPGQGNELRLLLIGYRSYRSGLAPVSVGAAAPLRDAWAWRHFWQNTGTLISSVLVLSLAAGGALLWRRAQRPRMYAWFTLAAAVWGVRNLNFVLTDNLSVGNLWWNSVSLAGAAGFVALFALFTQDYSRWMLRQPPPTWRASALPLGYLATSLLLLALPADTAQLRGLFPVLGLAGMALAMWSQWHLTRTAQRSGTRASWAVALAGAVYMALMVHDYAVAVDRGIGQLFLRQYAAVPLFAAFTLVWTQRYASAFEQVERLSRDLQQQVDAQRAEIERNVGQLMAAERERVLSHERERLVSDLHDGLGLHLLTALKMARDPQARRETLGEVLADCLDDLRLAIDSMSNIDERDPVLLLASLRFRLAPRLAAAGVQLDWQVQGEVPPQPWLDAPKALHLLRVVQEALVNAVRHGGATRVLLQVQARPAGVVVSVIDDGRGIGAGEVAAGVGLASMRRRAALLGATLGVGPGPQGAGTEVRLEVAA